MQGSWACPRCLADRITLLLKVPKLSLHAPELDKWEIKKRMEGLQKFHFHLLKDYSDLLDASCTSQGEKTELYSQHYRLKDGIDLQISPRFPVRTKISEEGYLELWGTALDQSRGYMTEYLDPDFSVRIEYNPSKSDIRVVYKLLNVFRSLVNLPFHEFVKVSRLDIAIDYPVSLDPLLVSCKGVRSGGLFWGASGDPETLYLGSGSSAFYFRVYDKRKETLARQNKVVNRYLREKEEYDFKKSVGVECLPPECPEFEPLPANLWRIELEYKEPFFLSDFFPSEIHDRLNRLELFAGANRSDDWQLQFMVHMVERWGIKAALSYLPPATRKRWKDRLVSVLISEIEHPASVFTRQFPAIWEAEKSRILYALGYEGDTLKI